jgi:cobalt/nickel transport system permease protein
MHIPENYLSLPTCGVMAAAMVPVWVHAVRSVKKDVPKAKIPMLGVGAAFSFVAMMFNVPLPGGTTGHAVGGTLIAILLGPDAACLAVSIALLIQALLFGDGGVLAFGANCFNMAFVLPYVGYAVYQFLRKHIHAKSGRYWAAGVGSYAGINAAAFCAAVEFGIQPYISHDANGNPLNCPYGLNVSIPAMMAGHLTVFGAVEVIYTVAMIAFVVKTSSDLLPENTTSVVQAKKPGKLYALLAVLICLVPLGLLATGTAWGEWGSDEIAAVSGFSPANLVNGWELSALLPDYSFGGLPDAVGYILSAVIGVALCIIIFTLISRGGNEKTQYGPQTT